jgi:plasmid stability protein
MRIIDGMKQKINLTLDEKIIEEVKIQAVREHRSVSDIVEELLRGYLKSIKKR